MTQTVKAQIYQDDEEDDPDLSPERGRWLIDVDVPGVRGPSRRAHEPGALIAWAHRWGRERGVYVEIKFLHAVGGPDG